MSEWFSCIDDDGPDQGHSLFRKDQVHSVQQIGLGVICIRFLDGHRVVTSTFDMEGFIEGVLGEDADKLMAFAVGTPD